MPKNASLHKAKKAKNDEFYTQYIDIEKEMNAYLEFNPDVFKDKTILLPCDDPEWSNFTKYFAQNFQKFGLKKLISTSYAADSKPKEIPYQLTLFETDSPKYDKKKTRSHGKIFTLERDTNKDKKINIDDLEWDYLKGDGDFRSDEIKKLRDESDIIITNPPFSLFREYLEWILDGDEKLFVVIANKNCITYKEVFKLIKDNKLWIGKTPMSVDLLFEVPDNYKEELIKSGRLGSKYRIVNGIVLARTQSIWLTNIDHGRRHEPLPLMTMADNLKFSKHKEIREHGYLKYDNYDAIEVPYTDAIPSDYREGMGVPISFLDKYNPDQFDLVKFRKGNDGRDLGYVRERERENYSVLQNHHQKEGDVTALWESRSHSSINTVRNNLKLSAVHMTMGDPMDGQKESICQEQFAVETSIKDCSSRQGANGIMGVPISFLDKFSPDQFEIIGATESEGKGFSNGLWNPASKVAQPLINGNKVYKRIFIKHKEQK